MSHSRTLAVILAGCLTTLLCLETAFSAQPPEEQIIVQKTEQTTSLAENGQEKEEKDRFACYPEHVKANHHCLLKHIQASSRDYIGQARQISSGLEKSIKKYGIKRILVIHSKLHSSCLDLALDRINRKMTAKEFDEKAKQISREFYGNIEKTNVSAPIDFTREIIIEASLEDRKLSVLFYGKLLNSCPNIDLQKTDRSPNYGELTEAAFSEKQYSKLILKKVAAIDKIYDAILKSRVGFKGLFAVSGINKMRKFDKSVINKRYGKYSERKSAKNPKEEK